MRSNSKPMKTVWRALTALVLICGIIAPMLPKTQAAKQEYRYDKITEISQLPTGSNWVDYIIAWEDGDKVWITDYEYFQADGESNVMDHSGWIEYRSPTNMASLSEYKAEGFVSSTKLGHLQLQYAGTDSGNNNAPTYRIRVQSFSGGYYYFAATDLETDPSEADRFTFQKKGDYFYISVNRSNMVDKQLIRDGKDLETNEASTASDSECKLMLYTRTALPYESDGNVVITGTDQKIQNGRVDFYEYTRVKSQDQLFSLLDKEGGWSNVMLAWEHATGTDEQTPSTVYYTKGLWVRKDGLPNYDDTLGQRYTYYANSTLGSDPMTSATEDVFVTQEPMTHFQLSYAGEDSDNKVNGKAAPKFYIRFKNAGNKYTYLNTFTMQSNTEELNPYTFQCIVAKEEKYLEQFWIYVNQSGSDMMLCRNANTFGNGSWLLSKRWEFPFRLYWEQKTSYEAIVADYTVTRGATARINDKMVIANDVTITVEDGGTLIVDEQLYNNGHIRVLTGGTLIINDGGYIMPYGAPADCGDVAIEGGNVLVLGKGKLLCDAGEGKLTISQGGSLVNWGVTVVSKTLSISQGGMLLNERTGTVIHGQTLKLGRGGVGSLSVENLKKNLALTYGASLLMSEQATLINRGNYRVGGDAKCVRTSTTRAYSEEGGTIENSSAGAGVGYGVNKNGTTTYPDRGFPVS